MRSKQPKPQKPSKDIAAEYAELDLAAEAAAGRLSAAFEVDDYVSQLSEVIGSGKAPLLVGDQGVGKTAVVHELARRLHAGTVPPGFEGKRIVQYSLQLVASRAANPGEVPRVFQRLVDALIERKDTVVPFFRDAGAASHLYLVPQLIVLAIRLNGVLIAEGELDGMDRLAEDHPEFARLYVKLQMDEPSPERSRLILSQYTAREAATRGRCFDAGAIEATIALTHRFLSRWRMPRKGIELLSQVGTVVGAGRVVGEADVIERFCRAHRVPRDLVDPQIRLDLPALETRFRGELLGQPEAVSAIVSMIGLVKAGLSDFRRPFGVFLFVGPTGVGKTHAAQLLAEYLFGSRERVLRVNMADYQDPMSSLLLFGNSDAYKQTQIRGALTQLVIGHPFAVLLLDEFEKAHASVHDRFMQLFDEGAFINAAGETVGCRSMIIIATSNAGAEVYRGLSFGFTRGIDPRARAEDAEARLRATFRWELLNRFDRIVHFRPLNRDEIRAIAMRELTMLRFRFGLQQRSLDLLVDESVLDWLTVHGYDPDNGARSLRRVIERYVSSAIAETIVRENPPPGAAIELRVRNDEIVAKLPRELALAVRKQRAAGSKAAADAGALRDEARRILESAGPLLDRLESQRLQREDLLEQINSAGFWEQESRKAGVLERFRTIDVVVHVGERFARSITALEEAEPSQLARLVPVAANALTEWRERLEEEAATPVWIMIADTDALGGAPEWVAELTRMEMSWCRRLQLNVRVVGVEAGSNDTRRVLLEAIGPGASSLLAMESGVHRLRQAKGKDQRARIDLIPISEPSDSMITVEPVHKSRHARLDVELAFSGSVELSNARRMTMHGTDRLLLAHALRDLGTTWGTLAPDPETARIYGEPGGTVRDPRTDESGVRVKDALQGRLEVFLDAWRAARPGP